jgi:hypothetical protein
MALRTAGQVSAETFFQQKCRKSQNRGPFSPASGEMVPKADEGVVLQRSRTKIAPSP